MPRYRVDVYLHDDICGVVAHMGSVNVDAPNKRDAEQQGYDWFHTPEWHEMHFDVKVFTQRIPKAKGVPPDNIIARFPSAVERRARRNINQP